MCRRSKVLSAPYLSFQLCDTVKKWAAVTQLFLPADKLCLVTEAAGHDR